MCAAVGMKNRCVVFVCANAEGDAGEMAGNQLIPAVLQNDVILKRYTGKTCMSKRRQNNFVVHKEKISCFMSTCISCSDKNKQTETQYAHSPFMWQHHNE